MPRIVQVIGRKCAANMLQLPAGRPDRFAADLHMRLLRRAPALFQVTWQACGGNIFPTGNPAQSAWDDMIERQIMAAAAIDTLKFIAQE